MATGLRSYPQEQRKAVIQRRLRGKSRGLGYLAAVDASKQGA